MSTKIQINSKEALERLIGNDSELEVELRNSIVQEFSKKYLKSVVLEPKFQRFIIDTAENLNKALQTEIQSKIGEIVVDFYGKAKLIRLNDATKAIMQEKADEHVSKLVSESIQSAINKYLGESHEHINTHIENRISYYVNEYINVLIKQKMDKAKKAMESALQNA